MSKQTSRLRALRRLLLLCLALGGFSQTLLVSCQPVPLSLQWGNPDVFCGDTTAANTRVSAGTSMDVELNVGGTKTTVARSLALDLRLFSQLAFSSDSSRLMPESNFVTIDKITYFFTYPANFSLPQDPSLFPESSPREQSVYFRINPTVQAQTQGGGQGAFINTDPSSASRLAMTFITFSLSQTLLNAQELNSGTQSFDVILNVKASGTTGWGSKIETNFLRYPITICKGCSGCVLTKPEDATSCTGINGSCGKNSGN